MNPESGERAGVGMYTYQLVLNLIKLNKADELNLFFDEGAEGIAKQFKTQNSKLRIEFIKKPVVRIPFVYSHLYLGRWLNKFNLDVFHGPANVAPLTFKGKFVVTIHDLAIYRHPEWFPSGQAFSKGVVVPSSLRRADRIIAVSEATKKDIIDIHKILEDKIAVIPNGVDLGRFHPAQNLDEVSSNVRRKYKIDRPYILYLGTLEPRKNLIRLVEAYSRLRDRNPELANSYRLVLAGSRGWLIDELFELVKDRGLQDSVVFPGYIPDEDVPALMQGAEIFVFPSLYEGFGLPVLEALACGTPVVCSKAGALPEAGGDVPSYVNPLETDGISNAIELLLQSKEDKERQMELGPRHAQKFSWAATAQKTHEIYKSVVG